MQKPNSPAAANHFRNISNLARFIDASQDAEETYRHLTRGVCEHSQWDLSSIQVLDLEAGLAIPIARHDPLNDGDLSNFPSWDAQTSPVSRVLKEGKPLILPDAAAQVEFPGYRVDALKRGYHTAVVIPLEVRDAERRPMVYSVASRRIIELDEADLSFLQCVAELSTIAVRKMRKLDRERAQAQRMRTILENMTSSLAMTLDSEAAGSLVTGLSSLFPAGWLAVDLTSGRGLFDPEVPPPIPLVTARRVPEELIAAALASRVQPGGTAIELTVAGATFSAEVSALQIDGSHVGALFFFRDSSLSDHERIAAQAGRLALSAFILRNFVEFKSRRVTARRLLSRLLSGEWRDLEEIQDEADRLDFDLHSPCRLLVLRVPSGTEVDDSTHSFILRSAQAAFGPAISCLLDGALILLLSDHEGRAPEQQDQFLSRIRPFLPQATLLVLSDLLVEVDQLSKARETCANTLDVAQSMKASGWVTPVTVGEFPTLMASADRDKVQAFLDSVLPDVLGKEGRKAQVAAKTIEVFLQTGRRYQETADQLGIHVSTLRYRLEQLGDQYGLDFNDSDRCFDLELALRLVKIKNSYES